MTNSNEILRLAQQTVETLRPLAGDLVLHLSGHALWDWLKTHLHGAGKAALEAVEQAPDSNDEWEALQLRIKQALTNNPALVAELAALLPQQHAAGQSMTTIGDNNTGIQASGSNIHVNANRGAVPQAEKTP